MFIELFAPANSHPLEVAGPLEVFLEANKAAASEFYKVQVVAELAGLIPCASGLRVAPDRTIRDPDPPIDTLIIAGTYDVPAPPSREVVAWLQKRCSEARRYGAVCTGAFLLGAAGLLDGRRVTTHWEYTDKLAAAYPSAMVEPDQIFLRDGPMFTSAGVTASIDLSLALVEEDHGSALALAIARELVMFLKRPGGQSQFSVHLAAQTATRSPVQQVQEWIRDNPRADLSVAELAKRAVMSERNFARIFRQESGMTPADFVEATRIDVARRLLEQTGLSIQRVAANSGFSSTEALRRAFFQRLGVTPREYRLRFSAADPQVPRSRH